jgi:hypothetical protein
MTTERNQPPGIIRLVDDWAACYRVFCVPGFRPVALGDEGLRLWIVGPLWLFSPEWTCGRIIMPPGGISARPNQAP